MKWRVHEDSDGHRWLVAPNGMWWASFVAELTGQQIKALLAKLNKGGG